MIDHVMSIYDDGILTRQLMMDELILDYVIEMSRLSYAYGLMVMICRVYMIGNLGGKNGISVDGY